MTCILHTQEALRIYTLHWVPFGLALPVPRKSDASCGFWTAAFQAQLSMPHLPEDAAYAACWAQMVLNFNLVGKEGLFSNNRGKEYHHAPGLISPNLLPTPTTPSCSVFATLWVSHNTLKRSGLCIKSPSGKVGHSEEHLPDCGI